MTIKKAEVLEALVDYNENELEEIIAKAQFLKILKTRNDDDDDYELFYLILSEEIKRKTGVDYADYYMFKRTKTFKELKKTVRYIKIYTASILKVKTQLLPKKAFLQATDYYVSLTLKYLKNKNIPIILKTLLNLREYFPGMLENEFPDYISSGFADLRSEERR